MNLTFSGQSLVYGLMAMTTLRMKCLWCPYICIMAAVLVCDPEIWRFITEKLSDTKKGDFRLESTKLVVALALWLRWLSGCISWLLFRGLGFEPRARCQSHGQMMTCKPFA